MSTNHSPSVPLNKQVGQLRPSSAGGKYKAERRGSPIMQKITALFKRERNTENGHVAVRPACFADSPPMRRSESPEPAAGGAGKKRSSAQWKAGKYDSGKGSGVGWRPKGRLEWESDSGRQITIGDVSVNELSKVEIQAMQRLAITILQGMDLPVSHGLLKGSRNVFQRLSFNSLKQRKVNGVEKIVEGPPGPMLNSGVFGQPLNQVVYQDQPIGKSGSGTPVTTTPTSCSQHVLYPTSTSPTSITSSEASFADIENTPTSVLLEALSISPAYSSPKSKRRLSLCPAEPQVPNIVTKAISYLDSKGVKTEGLFRISGAKSRINEIREKFDSGEDVELTDDMNPHDVACLLKEFFRSLPEPLMTVDLFVPFLATRRLSSSAQRRDALRLLCLLLPQPNRDTLLELLQFLSRVALHSDGIILIDGTEEVGNRMTEQNLAMILGPNILHKEVKRRSQKPMDYQVQKQDPEELNNVCKVMEDLIRMQLSIFMVPAQLYEACLKSLLSTDAAAVDMLLKRRCYQQGLFLDESPSRSFVSRSRSTDALRKISQVSGDLVMTLEQELQEQEFLWQRNHSLSDTQKELDAAIRDLEEDLADFNLPRRYSSNDSAMGGSEAVVSPMQLDSTCSEPSTLCRKRQVHDSVDSAFSNYSSPTNSSEGVHHTDILSFGSDMAVPCNHIRMSSEASNTSATASPVPRQDSPEPWAVEMNEVSSPLSKVAASSLPVLDVSSSDNPVEVGISQQHGSLTLPSHGKQQQKPSQETSRHSKKNKHKTQTLPPKGVNSSKVVRSIGTYKHQRSPILSSKDHHVSESQLDTVSSDHTPTESTINITSSPSGFSLDSGHLHGTVI